MAFSLGETVEYFNQENILYVIIVVAFFMGVFACRVATRLLEVSHAARIAQSTIYSCLLMCAKVNEDIAFLSEIKRKHMTESGMEKDKIRDFLSVDKRIMDQWRNTIVQKIILYAPRTFGFIIKFTTWREAMNQLEEMHRGEEI